MLYGHLLIRGKAKTVRHPTDANLPNLRLILIQLLHLRSNIPSHKLSHRRYKTILIHRRDSTPVRLDIRRYILWIGIWVRCFVFLEEDQLQRCTCCHYHDHILLYYLHADGIYCH